MSTFNAKAANLNRIHDSISTLSSFATINLCNNLVSICESPDNNNDGMATNKAFTNSDPNYKQSTTDIEVDSHKELRRFLRQTKLSEEISNAMYITHNVRPVGYDDLFVVKYEAKKQKELLRHFDGGSVSFMIALSDSNDYDGGGTKFDCLEETLHLEVGDIVLFDANLYHKGIEITKGTRYLLVGFCIVEGSQVNVGNIKLSLRRVKEESNKRKRVDEDEHEHEDIEENKDVVEDEDDELEAQQTALDDAKAAKQAYTPATKKNDQWWPNGSFSNIGLTNWHVQRAAWNVPKGKRRPLPPPFDNEAVIEGLSAQRVRHFELPGWIGLSDLIDTYVDIWEIDE